MNENLTSRCKTNRSERGAALVMVLMVSALLLVACIGMLTASTYNTKNVTDSIAEDQAYYAAESGLQATINVLRGNTSTAPNKINFTKAVKPSTSNASGDSSPTARLSAWLTYGYTSSGATSPDRVIIGEAATTYNPNTGLAYSITVSDPDNTQNTVAFNTTGAILSYDTEGDSISGAITNSGRTVSYPNATAPNRLSITFNNKAQNTVNVASGTGTSDVGSFTVTKSGTGATITDALRFQISYNMTLPYEAIRVMYGTIYQDSDTGVITAEIDSPIYFLQGSTIKLSDTAGTYSKSLGTGSNNTVTFPIDVTPAEPLRLLVKSVGYGPRNSRKELESIVKKDYFNDLGAPASLTLISCPTCGVTFVPGSSANVTYSGQDEISNAAIPSIGLTNAANLRQVQQTNIKTDPDPPAALVSSELPQWLSTAKNLDDTIKLLRTTAKASGTYFASGETPDNFGVISGKGITFCDGDVSLNQDGGGILVVTGKLTLRGNFSFKGLIIVTGTEGMDRSGGGNGSLAGNTVVAPYNPARPQDGYLSPKYNISGGGTSELVYNSSSVNNGLQAISNFVLGVAEK